MLGFDKLSKDVIEEQHTLGCHAQIVPVLPQEAKGFELASAFPADDGLALHAAAPCHCVQVDPFGKPQPHDHGLPRSLRR